ncbi:MAG: XisI protein [Chloracidobacterium sp.]|nr:XisI protein [Chloracidobacterium sp.]
MDKLNQYREIIEQILSEIVRITERSSEASRLLRDRTVFDRRSDNYLIVREGWEGPHRIDCNVVHLEVNDKIWIQVDNTDQAIARRLEAAGVPKSEIVLGFQPPCPAVHRIRGDLMEWDEMASGSQEILAAYLSSPRCSSEARIETAKRRP